MDLDKVFGRYFGLYSLTSAAVCLTVSYLVSTFVQADFITLGVSLTNVSMMLFISRYDLKHPVTIFLVVAFGLAFYLVACYYSNDLGLKPIFLYPIMAFELLAFCMIISKLLYRE